MCARGIPVRVGFVVKREIVGGFFRQNLVAREKIIHADFIEYGGELVGSCFARGALERVIFAVNRVLVRTDEENALDSIFRAPIRRVFYIFAESSKLLGGKKISFIKIKQIVA